MCRSTSQGGRRCPRSGSTARRNPTTPTTPTGPATPAVATGGVPSRADADALAAALPADRTDGFGRPLDPTGRRLIALREAGYTGPIDQHGYPDTTSDSAQLLAELTRLRGGRSPAWATDPTTPAAPTVPVADHPASGRLIETPSSGAAPRTGPADPTPPPAGDPAPTSIASLLHQVRGTIDAATALAKDAPSSASDDATTIHIRADGGPVHIEGATFTTPVVFGPASPRPNRDRPTRR